MFDMTSACFGTKQSKGWAFENPFSEPVSARCQQASQFVRAAFPHSNRASVSSKRQSTSGDVPGGSDSYRTANQHWPYSYHNGTQKYSQDHEDPYDDNDNDDDYDDIEDYWNIFNQLGSENKVSAEEIPFKHRPTKWQCHTENDESHYLQPLTKYKAINPSMNRQEFLAKGTLDYDALIRNMEEMEEREINSHLRDDFCTRTEMGDWLEDSDHATPNTPMLENFEELEQLIQEEDDDVQLALHIQNRQIPSPKESLMSNDYLELQRPFYQF